MKLQLTIVGLGQIGASFGLALENHKELVRRVGYDVDRNVEEQARKIGAVDDVALRLPAAVKNADAVLLAIPINQMRSAIEVVAPEMKPGAVLMDTAPIKMKIAEWALDLLPEGSAYVGLTPVIGPQYLLSDETGLDAAHADLFQNGLIAISTPPGSASKALKLAADLVRLVGASPLFADLAELDGLMTATHIAPQFIGAALLNATVDQPGWREARKLAGRAYAEVSGPIVHLGEAEALASTAMLNRENLLRVLGSMIASLTNLREDIQREDYAMLTERLERARQGRAMWWNERQEANWDLEDRPKMEISTASSVFGNLLRFGSAPRRENGP